MLLLLSSLAFALDEDRVRVLVSEFQPRNEDSKALASLVENFLASRLKENQDIELVRPEQLPPFQDYSARIYLEGCPAGDMIGCTYVAAERGEVEWAITGTTRVTPSASKVQVEILDIRSGRVVVSFESELESGQDEKFAEAVAEMLSDAIGGSFNQTDIRQPDPDSEDPEGDMRKMSDDAIAQQLDSLSQELGDISTVINRPNSVIERPDYTMDDLADQMQGEGTKPWERLNMSPGEYLRYKNSGRTLDAWRQLATGRQGQLLIRPTVGFGIQPSYNTYYGRYAYDSGQVVDVYTAQAVTNGFGGYFTAGVAYGVHPSLDVGVDFGIASGRVTRDYQQQTVGQTIPSPEIYAFQDSSFVFGPRIVGSFIPVSPIRPVVGGAVQFWLGDTVRSKEVPPEGLANFPAPLSIIAEVMVGAELRLTKRVDFFVHVPVDLTVGGSIFQEKREGSADVLQAVQAPAVGSMVSGGLRAGLQVRLFGKKVKSSILDEMEEEP